MKNEPVNKQLDNNAELFRLASLIGCEPEDEERHRKQLLDFVNSEKVKELEGLYIYHPQLAQGAIKTDAGGKDELVSDRIKELKTIKEKK